MTTESCMTVPLSKAPRVSCPTDNLLAAPRLFAPGGVAPARHENPRADRASYWWDRTLAFFTQAFDGPELRHCARKFGLRLGDINLVGALPHGIFRALF